MAVAPDIDELRQAPFTALGTQTARRKRTALDGQTLQTRQALFPSLVQHQLARRLHAQMIAGDAVFGLVRPIQLTRMKAQSERLQDGVQGDFGVAYQLLIADDTVGNLL